MPMPLVWNSKHVLLWIFAEILFFTFSLSLSFQPCTVPEWDLGSRSVYVCASLLLPNACGQDIAGHICFLCWYHQHYLGIVKNEESQSPQTLHLKFLKWCVCMLGFEEQNSRVHLCSFGHICIYRRPLPVVFLGRNLLGMGFGYSLSQELAWWASTGSFRCGTGCHLA